MSRRPPISVRLRLGTVFVFVASMTFVGCRTPHSQPAAMVTAGDGGLVRAFRFERPDHPRLRELARRERLEDLLDPAAAPFDQLLAIKDWAAGQWPAGNPDPYPPWDALTVLDWIREGKTGGFCAQYAQVFLQSLAALGFTARYVEVGSIDNPYAHYVTEVWAPDLGKWVLMDADYNLHFEREGRPLGVLEVHDALIEGSAGGMDVVRGTVREGHSDPLRWPLGTAELYYYVRFHLKADHLSMPGEPPFDRRGDMVEWLDARVTPWHLSRVDSPYPKERLTLMGVADRTVFERGPQSRHVP